MCKEVVVMVSGGIDSTVLAAMLQRDGYIVHAVTISFSVEGTFNYEVAFARENMQRLGITHTIIDLSNLSNVGMAQPAFLMAGGSINDCDDQGGSGGGGTGGKIDQSSRRKLPMSVPFMHMVGLNYAAMHGIDQVFWALHRDDLDLDSVPQHIGYVENMQQVAYLTAGEMIWLRIPFLQMSKAEVITLGLELGVDIENTYSCSAPGSIPCGSCAQCKRREDALKQALLPA